LNTCKKEANLQIVVTNSTASDQKTEEKSITFRFQARAIYSLLIAR